MKEKPKVEKVSLCEEDLSGTPRADDTLACETALVYRFDAKRSRDTLFLCGFCDTVKKKGQRCKKS